MLKIKKGLFMNFFIRLYALSPSFIKRLIIKVILKLDGGEAFSIKIRMLYEKIYGIKIGIGTYGCFDKSKIANNISIGNYCSFAQNVSIVPRREHPMNYISTNPLFFNSKWGFVDEEKISFNELSIGNDVWIGQNVVICSKCTKIGNGVVIAAGCVVNRDIPDYAVVGGVPAKIIKYRFDNDTINLINESKWFLLSPDVLKKYMNLRENPIEFAKLVKENANGGQNSDIKNS